MNYKITDGISQSELEEIIVSARDKYGFYEGDKVNYSKVKIAPIVMCTLIFEDKLLLVKRGHGLADANGLWSTVNGFIDELIPVSEIAKIELIEELSLDYPASKIKVGKSYTLKTSLERKDYIIFPCLIVLDKKPDIILNEENTDYKWIKRSELNNFEILEDLPYAIDSALKLI